MLDLVTLKDTIGYDKTIGTDEAIDTSRDAKSSGSVVTVEEQEFYCVMTSMVGMKWYLSDTSKCGSSVKRAGA